MSSPGLPIDWWKIDQSIAENCHVMPAQIDQMTLSEIACLLDTSRRGGDRPSLGDENLDASIRRWQQMTPRERLIACRTR